MSMTQYLFMKRSKVPSAKALQASIDALGFDLKLSPTLDLLADEGFVPCVLDGEDEAGFELSREASATVLEELTHLEAHVRGRELCLQLIWHAGAADAACGSIVAYALVKDFGAVTSFDGEEPQASKVLLQAAKDLLEEARRGRPEAPTKDKASAPSGKQSVSSRAGSSRPTRRDRQLQWLFEPLLAADSSLATHGKFLFFKPIRHFFRGVIIARANSDPDTFEVKPHVHLMAEGAATLHGTYSKAIPNGLKKGAYWDLGDEDTPAVLLKVLSDGPLQLVHAIDTFEAFLPYFQGEEHRNGWPELVVAMSYCALGRYADAREILAPRVTFMRKRGFLDGLKPFETSYFSTAPRMLQALDTDTSQVPKLLHEFEQAKVRSEGLEPWHVATPFPCEIDPQGYGPKCQA